MASAATMLPGGSVGAVHRLVASYWSAETRGACEISAAAPAAGTASGDAPGDAEGDDRGAVDDDTDRLPL